MGEDPSSGIVAALLGLLLGWSAARNGTPQEAVSDAPTIAASKYRILDIRLRP